MGFRMRSTIVEEVNRDGLYNQRGSWKSLVRTAPLSLNVTFLDFVKARVHTTLGFRPPPFIFCAEFCSAFFGSLWQFDSSSKLNLHPDFNIYLRDFSRTGRIGELAQALSYIFATKQQQYIFGGDTHGFLRNAYPGRVGFLQSQRVSDYLFYRESPSKQFLALESKGTACSVKNTNSAIKNGLKNGLEQCAQFCESARLNLNFFIHKSICTTCVFRFDGDPEDTFMVFVDPEDAGEVDDKQVEKLRQYHLSKWFNGAGRRDLAEKMLKGELTEELLKREPKYREKFVSLNKFEFAFPSMGSYRKITLNFLIDLTFASSWREPVYEEGSKQVFQSFCDGTAIEINISDKDLWRL